jgi:hypothetical protein
LFFRARSISPCNARFLAGDGENLRVSVGELMFRQIQQFFLATSMPSFVFSVFGLAAAFPLRSGGSVAFQIIFSDDF